MPKRMWDEKEIIKIAEEHGGEGGGAVQSVNGKTGAVVLSASDINATNAQSVQANLERIDLEVEGLVDDVADLNTGKLDASKSAVSTVGGLVTPMSTPTSDELVGIDTTGAQSRVTIGSGLTLVNGELSAQGGGGGGGSTKYMHNVHISNNAGWGNEYYVDVGFTIINDSPTPITSHAACIAALPADVRSTANALTSVSGVVIKRDEADKLIIPTLIYNYWGTVTLNVCTGIGGTGNVVCESSVYEDNVIEI